MTLPICAGGFPDCSIRVPLRGSDPGVTEEHLNVANVRSMIEEMAGERMPKHVGGDLP
jgi:hypothetical protein